MKYIIRAAKGIAGGVGCALTWYLMDRFIFGDVATMREYTAVVFAYCAGTAPISGA